MAVGVFNQLPCFHPLRAFRAPGGQIVFSRAKGWSDRPLDLPCGQCIGCRIQKSRVWAMRCVHEAQMHEKNSFVTLTYSPKHLPKDGGLHVRHWQLFAKRLRKKVGSFRYFHCGEYGSENQRPHYHALIFGLDFSGDRSFHTERAGNRLYKSKLLEDTWGRGFCSVGDLTYESAAYVARYCLKKITGPEATAAYERVDPDTGECFQVKPEYVSMSLKPGIGSKWFDKFKSDVYPADEVVIEGRRFRPPRFYDDKLPEKELEVYQAQRMSRVGKRLDDLTPDRLEVREGVALRKQDDLVSRDV